MALVKCRCGKLFGRSGYVQQPWGRFAEMFLGGIEGAGRSEVE